MAVSSNERLVRYLRANSLFHVVQHGWDHTLFEFELAHVQEARRRLDRGSRQLSDAGFSAPRTFVAPYDRLSAVSLHEVAARFCVLSTGWFELRRVPLPWWPAYFAKKLQQHPHWRIGRTVFLSHPGCLLSHHRPSETMLREVQATVLRERLTVLVTHWWEYFRAGQPNAPFIGALHEVAEWLGRTRDIRVVSFDDVAEGRVPIA